MPKYQCWVLFHWKSGDLFRTAGFLVSLCPVVLSSSGAAKHLKKRSRNKGILELIQCQRQHVCFLAAADPNRLGAHVPWSTAEKTLTTWLVVLCAPRLVYGPGVAQHVRRCQDFKLAILFSIRNTVDSKCIHLGWMCGSLLPLKSGITVLTSGNHKCLAVERAL